MDLSKLSAEFPPEQVHWRAGQLTRSKDKAMALAYLDARDVMDRLDAVCGPENWQSEFTETASGRVVCRIGIRFEDDWIWKSDGAGSTDIEGEKGGLSDALKRAAVAWGIGRYLYRLPTPWVPCELGNNGKWRDWKEDPWSHVRRPRAAQNQGKPTDSNEPSPEPGPEAILSEEQRLTDKLSACTTKQHLAGAWKGEKWALEKLRDQSPQAFTRVSKAKDALKARLMNDPANQAPPPDHVSGGFDEARA